MLLVAGAFGAVIGLAVGALGGGGSVLAVPVLVAVLGQDVEAATTVSLIVVVAGAAAGTVRHALDGLVCWRHATAFTAAAFPGILGGTALGGVVADDVLVAGFSAVMLVAAAAMWRRSSEPRRDAGAAGTGCPALRVGRDATAGLAVGFATGFFGVGGGFLVVPALAVGLALPMRRAVGTSLAIITSTSAAGVAVHLAAGRDVEAGLAIAMGLACAAGAVLGARASARLPQPALARWFAGLVVAVAAGLLASVV